MKLDVLRISLDRRTGEEINRAAIGQKAINKNQLSEGCVRFLTGKSTAELVGELIKGSESVETSTQMPSASQGEAVPQTLDRAAS